MNINELHRKAMTMDPMFYDPRLPMTLQQYDSYRTNYGHTYYLYLSALIQILKPKKVLELGTDIGRSAAFMMLALPKESTFTTIEKHSLPRTDLEPFREDPRLRIVVGDDLLEETYRSLDLEGTDFLFIDSEHTSEHLSMEWSIYRNFLTPDAVVVFDDIHLNDGMRKFWSALPFEKVDCGRDVHFSGFGIASMKR